MKGAEVTIFRLVLETREGKKIAQVFRAQNSDLLQYPKFYGNILDAMCWELEKRTKNIL